MERQKIAVIGECMVEMKRKDRAFGYAFGGDTLNTAVYLSRLLPRPDFAVHYLTALGTDTLSDEMEAIWVDEGIETAGVQRLADKLPGLYLIETDDNGERSFRYWRSDSAARYMLRGQGGQLVRRYVEDARYLYLSGITLAILGDEDRTLLCSILRTAKSRGATIVFDNNYRPRLWKSKAQARSAYDEIYALAEMALVTVEDHVDLYDEGGPDAIAVRLHGLGVNEIVIKRGHRSCLVSCKGRTEEIPAIAVEHIVDTTAAGDSFGAAYLAARLSGADIVAAAHAGHRLAATVIQYSGAIIPREAMTVTSQ